MSLYKNYEIIPNTLNSLQYDGNLLHNPYYQNYRRGYSLMPYTTSLYCHHFSVPPVRSVHLHDHIEFNESEYKTYLSAS